MMKLNRSMPQASWPLAGKMKWRNLLDGSVRIKFEIVAGRNEY
jgi:hypothetical protein